MNIERPAYDWANPLTKMVDPVRMLVVHHTAHPTWDAMDVHRYHRNSRGWAGIGYNWMVYKDGWIVEGRGEHLGAHASGRNSDTLGIALQGDCDKNQPPIAQLTSLAKLLAHLCRKHGLAPSDIVGHRDLAATACPGRHVDLSLIRKMVGHELERPSDRIPVTIEVNGKRIDADAYVEDGRTMVPVRAVAEALGARVLWDQGSRIVRVLTESSKG